MLAESYGQPKKKSTLVDRKKRGRPKGSRGRSLGGPKRTKNEEDDPMKEKRGRKVKNG